MTSNILDLMSKWDEEEKKWTPLCMACNSCVIKKSPGNASSRISHWTLAIKIADLHVMPWIYYRNLRPHWRKREDIYKDAISVSGMSTKVFKDTPSSLTREESSTYASASSSPYETPKKIFDQDPFDRSTNDSSPFTSETNTSTTNGTEKPEDPITTTITKSDTMTDTEQQVHLAHGEEDGLTNLPPQPLDPKEEDEEEKDPQPPKPAGGKPRPKVNIDDTPDVEAGIETKSDTGANTGADFEQKVAEERKTSAGDGEEATDEEMDKVEKRLREIIDNALQTIEPFLKQMVEECTEAEEKHKKGKDFDEEQFVEHMKKTIKQASEILEGALQKIQAVDPDKKVQRRANRNAEDNKASPNQRFIADGLKKLSEQVQKTIDDCKAKIKDMPHAKSQLDGMFGMLSRPLFQILSAVGLLVYGVLNLLGEILDTLGLGGLFRGLTEGLGINKLLNALGWKLQIVKTNK